MRALVTRVLRRTGIDLPPDEWAGSGRSRFLEEVLPKGGIGAEIGVHKGYFTPVLYKITQPKKLHIIDPWYLMGREMDLGCRRPVYDKCLDSHHQTAPEATD